MCALCEVHVEHHASRITHHASHITHHTSHITRHTSHVTLKVEVDIEATSAEGEAAALRCRYSLPNQTLNPKPQTLNPTPRSMQEAEQRISGLQQQLKVMGVLLSRLFSVGT